MSKAKKIFKSARVIILLIFLILAILAIRPTPGAEGVAIRSVVRNSSAASAGMVNPLPTASPMSREVILTMNNRPIETEEDYYNFANSLSINDTVTILTTEGLFKLTVKADMEVIELNATERKAINETVEAEKEVDGEIVKVNETKIKYITVKKTKTNILGPEDIGLRVYPAPKNNLIKGLELQGGTRVLLKPEVPLNESDMEILLDNMKQRLNVFGLTDIIVTKTRDLTGEQFILIEIAGFNEEEVKDLISKQGKFEARVGNKTVFEGGKDITYVCRTADCSGIDPRTGCSRFQEGMACSFLFSISLSPEAAKKHADITAELPVITENNQDYLNESLVLLLDDQEVDSLRIGAELRGRATTEIAISGSGQGATEQDAMNDALKNMKRLQTIMITGSLPIKLEIVKTDAISSSLGEEFTKNAILVSALAILSVAIVVFIRYRSPKVAVPMVFTMASEIVLLLGLAALIRWNLDLAAIAGIIVSAGTGVDDQIVIIDEILAGTTATVYNWKEKLKKAFFIIMAAYFTLVVAMIPLLFVGAGMLKGFAFTTIAGVSFGVFLTRPAFAAVVEILMKDN